MDHKHGSIQPPLEKYRRETGRRQGEQNAQSIPRMTLRESDTRFLKVVVATPSYRARRGRRKTAP